MRQKKSTDGLQKVGILATTFPELYGHKKTVHFIGIGGIGMSALARWFLAAFRTIRQSPSAGSEQATKWLVSGSDLVKSPIIDALVKEGVEVKIGHKNAHIGSHMGLVIHTKAAESGNPELVEAKRQSTPTLPYSEAIGRLTKHYKTIAISGSHGKSTTTALASLALIKGGLDPTIIVGTNLKEFGGKNFRNGRSPSTSLGTGPSTSLGTGPSTSLGTGPSTSLGTGPSTSLGASTAYLVLEADEFGKSFLNYSPTVAVVTNIDLDHLDTYKNLADIKKTFLKFLTNTKHGGTLILNKDSKNLFLLRSKIKKIAGERNLKTIWYSTKKSVTKKIRKVMKVPGEHNVSNALTAYSTARALGIPEKKILSAIGAYHGAWRRMEYRGVFHASGFRFQVYDDYAHHPTEIKATLKAFREKHPRSPIICVYQPHQALRLKKLWGNFVDAFADADVLVLLPIYQVVGREGSKWQIVNSKWTSKTLATAIAKKYPKKEVFYLNNPKNIKGFLSINLNSSAKGGKFYILNPGVIVMMGAGDIANYTPYLLK